MPAKSFKDLIIWQRSIQLVESIYKLTGSFPNEELYGLSAQLRRAVVSIPSNIAEGFARRHNAEYRQFLYVSLGSLAEVSTQLIIAKNLEYLTEENAKRLLAETEEISKMTMSLIKKIH
jgi:four helix bundle protein